MTLFLFVYYAIVILAYAKGHYAKTRFLAPAWNREIFSGVVGDCARDLNLAFFWKLDQGMGGGRGQSQNLKSGITRKRFDVGKFCLYQNLARKKSFLIIYRKFEFVENLTCLWPIFNFLTCQFFGFSAFSPFRFARSVTKISLNESRVSKL